MMRVATSDMEAHTRVYRNLNCTPTGFLVRIAWARCCMKVAVPNVIGTVTGVTHHAHTPKFQREKVTRPPSNHKVVRRLSTPGMGATRLGPPTRSHKWMYVRQLGRLHVVVKECMPQIPRNAMQLTAVVFAHSHHRSPWPHGTSAFRRYWDPQTNSSIRCQHARKTMYTSSLSRAYSTRQIQGVDASMATGVVSTSDKSSPCLINQSSSR